MHISITLILVVITAITSFMGFGSQKLIDELIFYPPAVSRNNQFYRFFTCGFIHADWGHLIFNMLALYLFGAKVEEAFATLFGSAGGLIYLGMYLSALLISLLPTYFRNRDNYQYRSLGASGAVSAVIFAGLLLAPGTEVYMYFIPIPIPGFIFAPLYLLVSAFLEKRGGGNINHSAHIWGAIYGLLFTFVACKAVGFDVISHVVNETKGYMQVKGWIK